MKIILLLCTQLIFISSSFSEVKAIYNNDKVEISWSNPAHMNVDYFIIERSKNGKHFKEIMKVETGSGNCSAVEYFEIDYSPLNIKAFYRIKHVDVSGNSYYSNIVYAQNFNRGKALFGLFSLSRKNAALKDYYGKDILVVLIDASQQEFIARVNVLVEKRELIVTYVDVKLLAGEYLIAATSDNKICGKKINVIENYSTSAYTPSRE